MCIKIYSVRICCVVTVSKEYKEVLLYSYNFNPFQSKHPFKTYDRTLFFPYCTTGSRIGRPDKSVFFS